jgi:hypothetical protein
MFWKGSDMSDQIQLAIGAPPWRPSYDAELVAEYRRYDMPTAGIVSQAGCHYLFECLEGHVMNVNTWAYAPLLKKEEEKFCNLLDDAQAMAAAMDEIWYSRDVTVALASGDAIFTGKNVSAHKLVNVDIRRVVLEEIRELLDRERDMTGALESATR